MKNVYLIQNSNLSFDMDVSKIYSPKKYSLFLIINKFGLKKLKNRKQESFFEKIWEIENFSFKKIREIIFLNQEKSSAPLQIVTNAEEAVTVCGHLRVFFNNDMMNYDRFINKIIMKKLLDKNHILTPRHVLFDNLEYKKNPFLYLSIITKALLFPLIAKPIDSMSCMGIKKINSYEELSVWAEKVIFTDSIYEVDEYINGKVYNCDSYIKNKKIVYTQISECSNSCYDFICGLTKGTIVLTENNPVYKLLSEHTEYIHDSIGIPQGGVTHLELILTQNNKCYFIEIGHRSPGILIPAMYRKFLNVDTIESHILLQIDDEHDLNINYGPFSAWIAFPVKSGVLKKKYIPEIKSEYQLDWSYQIGDIMPSVTCGRDYAGRVLLWNKDYQQLKNDFDYLNAHNFFDVELI
jgi:hypothetical protein